MEAFDLSQVLFLAMILLVAFLYSSVGHGGASGYLAVLALFSVQPSLMKSSSLVLNIAVSAISFFQYYRGGHFRWKLFYPFALASIPASFAGAMISLQDDLYKKILGVCLLFPVLRFLLVTKDPETIREPKMIYSFLIGGAIGLLSGMIGIGGGILLSPVILLLHWANMKETAAVSALFILMNSISGLVGLLSKGTVIDPQVYLWLIVAIVGGTAGAYLGSKKLNTAVLRYILAFVLAIASLKLLLV